jgi:uncharacterized iron-regulated membrane protein
MSAFNFFWTTHRWTGIVLSSILVVTAVSGFLLLIKKKVAWIQPPTIKGAEGGIEDFITNQRLFEVVFAQQHPDFASIEDIDRVYFEVPKRMFKVISVRNNGEIQVDGITGEILSVGTRRSDLLETIHDGSFVGAWFHEWAMPVVPVGLLFLAGSGLFLWLEPKLRKARRRRTAAARD